MNESGDLGEVVQLLREIRNLLLPVTDAFREQYEESQRRRELVAKKQSTLNVVAKTPARKEVFRLLFGSEYKTQGDIAEAVGVSQPAVSQFVRILYENDLIETYTDEMGTIRVRNKYDVSPE